METLSKKLNVPFFIENNANCCAWSELAFHKNTELKNILFALIEFRQALVPHAEYGGVGVGFGIVLNGKVHMARTTLPENSGVPLHGKMAFRFHARRKN